MNYYIVTTKCGHVGKGFYTLIDFPVRANSKSEAAQKALTYPRVKKHLNDAIKDVRVADVKEYCDQYHKNSNSKYLNSKCKKDRLLDNNIKVFKNDSNNKKKKKSSFQCRKERILYILKKKYMNGR